MSVPALAGIGAGLGSFVQTGDIGKGIQTGMASFLGGKVLGGLSGSTSTNAINAAQGAPAAAATKPNFIQALSTPGTPATQVVAGTPSDLATKFLGTETANAAMPFGTGTKGGAFTAAQQGFMPGMIGQTMTDMQMIENRAAKDDEDTETRPPMPNPMIRTFNPNPYAGGFGEANYFSYRRPPRPDGSTPQYPYTYAEGGQLGAALPLRLIEGYEGPQIMAERRSDLEMRRRAMNPTPSSVFSNLSSGIRSIVSNDVESKVSPFIQRVEQDAKQTFGDIFSQGSMYGQRQPGRVFTTSPVTPAAQPSSLASPNSSKGSAKSQPQLPFYASLLAGRRYSEGGEVEVDEMMEDNSMNEKDLIMNAILAIKEVIVEEEAEMALAMFVMKYGEEALRNLVDKVQSGEFDETVERFAAGEQGMVRGPGDGSGVDDMVPATLEGEQDVLLSDGEFVLRKKTTDALEKAYGGGFLDIINRAEEDAPEKLERMVG